MTVITQTRGLVAGLDANGLDAAGARELVALGERVERLGRSLTMLGAARVVATQAWTSEGDRSPEDWMARTTGSTRQKAKRTVETGKQLEDLPATAEALRDGKVSAAQAEAIAGAAAANPAAEEGLLAGAKQESLRETQDACRKAKAQADPDPEATARRIHARRSYRSWTDPDGVGHLHLSGPAATIKRIDNAVRHRADRIFRQARRDGRREPAEAYAFDATEELVTRTGNEDGKPVPRGSDAKIIVRVDHAALLRGRTVGGEVCEIAGVGPVPVSLVKEWMNDAFVAAIFTKGTEITKVVHLGRRFTAEQRTALQWQDPTCARLGCANTLRLENDHLEDWAHTHTTRVEAGKRFCPACHRLKTIGWHVRPVGSDNKFEFLAPDHPEHPFQQIRRRRRTPTHPIPISPRRLTPAGPFANQPVVAPTLAHEQPPLSQQRWQTGASRSNAGNSECRPGPAAPDRTHGTATDHPGRRIVAPLPLGFTPRKGVV